MDEETIMNIIVIGSGGHASVVIKTIECQPSKWHIVGLVDDFLDTDQIRHGYKIIGKTDEMEALCYRYAANHIFIAVGDNAGRRKVYDKIERGHMHFPAFIHPTAVVCSAKRIGDGAFLAAGAVVGVNSTVGDFAIVNTNASIDHDSILGAFAHMAPNSATGGNVIIASDTLIGIGASIRNGSHIGQNCIIGMGSVVVCPHVPANDKGYGNPYRSVL